MSHYLDPNKPKPINLVPKPLAESVNDPAKNGCPASPARTFGPDLRYRVQARHTQYEWMAWQVDDLHTTDPVTGLPLVVRQWPSFEDAVRGLTHATEVEIVIPHHKGAFYLVHEQGSRLMLERKWELTREFQIVPQQSEGQGDPEAACVVLRRLLHRFMEEPNLFVRAIIERRLDVLQ